MMKSAQPGAAAPPGRRPADDRQARVEGAISTILRTGVLASLALVVAGIVVTFVRQPDLVSSPQAFAPVRHGTAVFPHTLGAIFSGVRHLEGQAIIALGLLVLVATPVVRVAVSILAFVYQHDRLYVKITSVVLFLLLLSFFLGHAGG